METYKFHPAANLFPMMDETLTEELTESIRDQGYDETEPLKIYQGQILDGRNRYLVCQALDIEPKVVEWVGSDPWHAVIRWNMTRRDLTLDQKTAIAAQAAPKLLEEARRRQGDSLPREGQRGFQPNVQQDPVAHSKNPTRDELAKTFNISTHQATQAMKLADREEDTEESREIKASLREEVRSGTKKAVDAVKILTPPTPRTTPEVPEYTMRGQGWSLSTPTLDTSGVWKLIRDVEHSVERLKYSDQRDPRREVLPQEILDKLLSLLDQNDLRSEISSLQREVTYLEDLLQVMKQPNRMRILRNG
jgi:hypothetical protein